MYVAVSVETNFEIKSLSDLPKFKLLMESLKMKINKSMLARELGVDRRTIDKHLKGFIPKTTKDKTSKIDEFYPIISELLSGETEQVFYFKRVLYQYLKDNHGLDCAQSSFRRYIKQKPEFQSYFKNQKPSHSTTPVMRYETPVGEQAQLDWKESIHYLTRDGERIEVNVGVLLLSYSRYRIYHLTISKTQNVLFSFLTEAFEAFGGVPKTIVTDNMKTVMDIARTRNSKGAINPKFAQFADDFGFKVQPCVAYTPKTKGKVEAPMKILDEIHAYQGKFNLEELHQFVQKLNIRVNSEVNQGSGKIPSLAFKKEKDSLVPLPKNEIRESYKIDHKYVKVNTANMISYKSNQYSLPANYIGKTVKLQIHDDQLLIYFNTTLIAQHKISNLKLNYKEEHYVERVRESIGYCDDIDIMAKRNLEAIGEVYQ